MGGYSIFTIGRVSLLKDLIGPPLGSVHSKIKRVGGVGVSGHLYGVLDPPVAGLGSQCRWTLTASPAWRSVSWVLIT